MSSFLRSLKNAAAAASDALLGRGGGSKPRPACQYGAKCYRKNPQHRIDESHPGDDDHDTPAGSRSRPAASAAPAADEHTAASPPAAAAAAADQEDEAAAAPRLKKAPSRRRGAAAAVAASEPASLSASASAAESSPAACVSPPPTNALPVPQLSPTSTGSSPRVDKKMSVRDRRRRAQLEAAASSTPSPVASPPPPDENVDAAAAAAPASLPPLPAASVATGPASSSTTSASLAAPASDDILLASLHALHHSPSSLVPEFVEIRWESPAQAASNRGDFFIGRASAGGAAKAADGTVVPRVHLPLASSTPRLAKMISRVHARISWTRTPLLTPAQQQQQRDGTHGLIKKRPGAGGDSASADQPPPAYTYKFFIEDEGSVNGLFVNSIKQASRGSPRLLSRGDKITFGGGAGRAEGEWLAQKAADAEFVFEFNCVEREPELPKAEATAARAEAGSDDESGPQSQSQKQKQPLHRNGTSSLRKRALSVAASSASAPAAAGALKRRKSEEDDHDATQEQLQPAAALLDRPASNVDMDAEDDAEDDADRADAVSEAASEDGSAGAGAAGDADAGATQNFGDGDDCGAHMDATQDYVDHDRDAERAHAQEQATQDFGGADCADGDDGAGATQDAGGMYE